MSVTTMTFPQTSAAEALAGAVVRAATRALRSVASLLQTAAMREPRDAQELLDWAEQYAASQPSYAADLRAAAMHHLGRAD